MADLELTAGTSISLTAGVGILTVAVTGLVIGTNVQAYNATLAAVAAGTYTGASSITTLGTITTGVWNGTAVTVPYGGTGVATLTGLVKGNGTSAFSAAVAGTDYLAVTGGTGVTTLGTVTTGTWNATAIGPTYGGTGITTYTTGDLLYASASNVLSKLAVGSNSQVLTLAGGVPTWATPSSGGTPGGSDTQVQFNDGGAFGGDSGLTFDKTNNTLAVGGATVTTSNPVLNLTQTWNAGGVAFTALKLNVTNTASAAASNLLDLQVGGTTQIAVQKNAEVGSFASPWRILFGSDASIGYSANGFVNVRNTANTAFASFQAEILNANSHVNSVNYVAAGSEVSLFSNGFGGNRQIGISSAGIISWSDSTAAAGTADTGFSRSSAGLIQVNNGTAGTYRDLILRNLTATGGTVTTSTPIFNGTQTWNDGAVTFTGLTFDVTNTASASSSLLLDLKVGGSSKYGFQRTGIFTVTGATGSYAGLYVLKSGDTYARVGMGMEASDIGMMYFGPGGATNSDTFITRVAGGIIGPRAGNGAPATGAALNFLEQTAPSAPSTNEVVLYAEDNGSGKTRLMARFATGAAQQIAIEP